MAKFNVKHRLAKVIKYNDTPCKETIYYYAPDEGPNDTWLLTQDGDRLDILAQQYYGESRMWWYICQINDLKPTINIPAGTKIRIPAPTNKFKEDI